MFPTINSVGIVVAQTIGIRLLINVSYMKKVISAFGVVIALMIALPFLME